MLINILAGFGVVAILYLLCGAVMMGMAIYEDKDNVEEILDDPKVILLFLLLWPMEFLLD
jgi:hypothetical protein